MQEEGQKKINTEIKKMLKAYVSQSKTLSSFMQSKGIKDIIGGGQKDYIVLHKKKANKYFGRMMQRCEKIAPEHVQAIREIRQDFQDINLYEKGYSLLPLAKTSQFQIKFLRIEFVKKIQFCFMGYQVFDLTFSLPPNLCLQKTSSSSGYYKRNFIWSAKSGSSSSYTQTIKQIQRGLTLQDLETVIVLANFGDSNREIYLQMLMNNQVQKVDY